MNAKIIIKEIIENSLGVIQSTLNFKCYLYPRLRHPRVTTDRDQTTSPSCQWRGRWSLSSLSALLRVMWVPFGDAAIWGSIVRNKGTGKSSTHFNCSAMPCIFLFIVAHQKGKDSKSEATWFLALNLVRDSSEPQCYPGTLCCQMNLQAQLNAWDVAASHPRP